MYGDRSDTPLSLSEDPYSGVVREFMGPELGDDFMLRLTLRTLLAYLDDTLSPSQAREIGQQIAEEPSINDLVTRIRNVMRRRRLLAESPDPDHADVDPNDVAEYLDSVLSPSRVAELEKRVLENDLDLAEVASVHQILSLVLGKPAEISSSAKERAYSLIKGRAKTHALLEPIGPKKTSSEPSTVEPIGSFNSGTASAPANRFGTSLVVLTLLVMLGVAVYYTVTNPHERPLPPVPGPAGEMASAKPQGGTEPNLGADQTKELSDSPPNQTDTALPAAPGPGVVQENGKQDVPLPKDELDAVPEIDNVTPKPATALAESPSDNEPIIPPIVPSADDKEKMAESEPDAKETEVAKSDLKPSPVEEKPTESADEKSPAATADIDSFVPVGTYASPTGMLLRKSSKGWERMQPQSQIFAGDLIADPPPGRSKIEFPTGLVLEMYSKSRVGLAFDPSFDLVCVNPDGQLIFTSGKDPVHLKLTINGVDWVLDLKNRATKVSIESNVLIPARLDSKKPAEWRVVINTFAGDAELSRDSQSKEIKSGREVVLISDQSGLGEVTEAPIPAWVNVPIEPSTDRLINRLSDEVPLGPGPTARFRELVEDNNKEMRLMAVGALASMGEIDALVDFLRHPKYAPVRAACFESLRKYARDGAGDLKQVQESLTRMYKPDVAGGLLELIVGYPDSKQWNVVHFKRLIERLDAEELTVREAAITNLNELTGKTFNYSADAASAQRRTAIGRWNKWMESQTDATLGELKPSKT